MPALLAAKLAAVAVLGTGLLVLLLVRTAETPPSLGPDLLPAPLASWSPPSLLVRTAYDAHAARLLALPESERRYVVLSARGGLGNKLRALMGALMFALAMDRLLILDERMTVVRQCFEPPVPVGVPFYWDDVPHLFADAGGGGSGTPGLAVSSVTVDADNRTLWAAFAQDRLDDVAGDPKVYLYATGGATVYLIRNVEVQDRIVAKLYLLGMPISSAELGRAVVQWLLASPRPAFQARVDAVKASTDWHTHALHVGVHVRTCIDCGRKRMLKHDAWANATLACARRAVREWQAEAATPPARTLLWLATDDVEGGWRPYLADALRDLGSARWHPDVTRFENSDDVALPPDRLEVIMSEFFLLGEAEHLVSTGTTFATFAALRRNRPARYAKDGTCTWGMMPQRDLTI